jgi:CRISPR-associated endoribonuclease Cas6
MPEGTAVTSPNLHALVIRLMAGRSGDLRATQGHLAHAAFLSILNQADPDTARAIHDYPKRKPFTLSPLGGFGRGRDGRLSITAGQEGWLRVTLLDPHLFQTFIRYFLDGGKPVIQLQRMPFQASEILNNPASHPLAGYDSLAGLADRWQTVNVAQDCDISLVFSSPTAFSQRGGRFRQMRVLPDPELLFGELARYWDALTGDNSRDNVIAYTREAVVISRHKLETHMYAFRNSKQVGFTGSVVYTLLDKSDLTQIGRLNQLADLAFYTGVGYKTTMGMGQVMRNNSLREAF